MTAAVGTKGRACTGKVRHLTKGAAEAEKRRLVREEGYHPGRIETYHCRHCGHFHVGHKPRRRR